jgi:hemerythrin-like domain-containing protein
MAAKNQGVTSKRRPVAKKAPGVKKPAVRSKAPAKKKVAVKKGPVRKRAVKKAAARKSPATASSSGASPATRRAAPAQVQPLAEHSPMIKALLAEHRHIATVMELFREQLAAIESGELVDTHVVYEVMDYMTTWPDRFHHPREDLIYGRAAELDASVADNVDSLQRDHDAMAEAGRKVLRAITQWRAGELDGAALVKSGRAYVDHQYQHMNNEENLVFGQIESLLSAQDWRELAQDDQLRPVSDPVFGKRVQREFRNLARKLRSNVRRGVERGTLEEWLAIEALMESLEVLSMAYESARNIAGEHAKLAWEESLEMFQESAVTAPWRCAANNTRLGLRFAQQVAEISRDALGDLSRVNQERKNRSRLIDG